MEYLFRRGRPLLLVLVLTLSYAFYAIVINTSVMLDDPRQTKLKRILHEARDTLQAADSEISNKLDATKDGRALVIDSDSDTLSEVIDAPPGGNSLAFGGIEDRWIDKGHIEEKIKSESGPHRMRSITHPGMVVNKAIEGDSFMGSEIRLPITSLTTKLPNDSFPGVDRDITIPSTIKAAQIIPKIIHQTWDDFKVPGQVIDWVQSWQKLHPSWQYMFWTDMGARRMLARKYSESLDLYTDYPYKINRADVRRYFMLYEYGGVYADLDVEALRPLDGLLQRYQCILGQEPEEHKALLYEYKHRNYAVTGFIACRPKHPFMKFLIDTLPHTAVRARTLRFNDNILKSTGPIFVAEVLEEYVKKYNRTADEYVHLAPAEWFLPTFDEINLLDYKKKCQNLTALSEKQQTVCKRLLYRNFDNSPGYTAYTNHHWLHSWAYNFIPNGFVDIGDIMKNITIVDR